MKKLIDKIKNNQGNSFVVVIATLSFLTVLTAALLVAVALIYRLKAYDLNAKDNFYYLEQAMDEIYSGIGADSMDKLVQSYDDTLETLVYYDTKNSTENSHKYTTMSNDQANAIMKQTFLYKLFEDPNFDNSTSTVDYLKTYLSYPYVAGSNEEGVQISIGNVVENKGKNLKLCDVTLYRKASYSTVNAYSKQKALDIGKSDDEVNAIAASGEQFIQSITTDIVIGPPSMDIKFETNAINSEELYEYSLIADMGIEITNKDGGPAIGDKVSITGNVYAASDFYNKAYNENPGQLKLSGGKVDTLKGENIQKVNSYSDERLKDCDGVKTKSMYSGIYVDGAEVVFASKRLIIPGTLAAMDCADITISSVTNSTDTWTDVWVDGIVLDGFSEKKDLEGNLKGSNLYARAKMYVYDDLEVNANSASVKLSGDYFGYNYASTDNRTYTKDSLKNGTRVFTKDANQTYKDGKAIEGQAHYNSSAIILNGANTNLDFTAVDNMYVAGQSYIELSKSKEKETIEDVTYTFTTKTEGDEVVTHEVTEDLDRNTYDYEGVKKDKDGNIVDNYSSDGKTDTQLKDYRTGEAVSIKSNQLAYIPRQSVQEDKDGNLYVSIPTGLRNLPIFTDAEDGSTLWEDLSKVPVIVSVVSGKKYYFYDFSKAVKTDAMNKFIENYASLFDKNTIVDETDETLGERLGLYNITNYDYFSVEALDVQLTDEESDVNSRSQIYTNSAITTKVGSTFTIKAKQQDMKALEEAARGLGLTDAEKTAAGSSSVQLTDALNKQYKEAKWMLTNKSSSADYKTEANALAEDCITPINHFFDFDKITKDTSGYTALDCGYGVWISDGDVEIGSTKCKIKGKEIPYTKSFKKKHVRGIILCKGDVTFSSDEDNGVNDFEGLIVSGGKIIINNFSSSQKKMALTCNAEIVKTVLRECDSTRGEVGEDNHSLVCDIFRLFKSEYKADSKDEDNVTYKYISSIQFGDIISLENWVKNVE